METELKRYTGDVDDAALFQRLIAALKPEQIALWAAEWLPSELFESGIQSLWEAMGTKERASFAAALSDWEVLILLDAVDDDDVKVAQIRESIGMAEERWPLIIALKESRQSAQ